MLKESVCDACDTASEGVDSVDKDVSNVCIDCDVFGVVNVCVSGEVCF